jgi:hypothetical protein
VCPGLTESGRPIFGGAPRGAVVPDGDGSLSSPGRRSGWVELAAAWPGTTERFGIGELIGLSLLQGGPAILWRRYGNSPVNPGLDVVPIIRLVDALRMLFIALDNATLIALTQITTELDEIYLPMNGRSRQEIEMHLWTCGAAYKSRSHGDDPDRNPQI